MKHIKLFENEPHLEKSIDAAVEKAIQDMLDDGWHKGDVKRYKEMIMRTLLNPRTYIRAMGTSHTIHIQ